MYKLGVFHDVLLKFLCERYMHVGVKMYGNCVTEAVLNVAAIFDILCCYASIVIKYVGDLIFIVSY